MRVFFRVLADSPDFRHHGDAANERSAGGLMI